MAKTEKETNEILTELWHEMELHQKEAIRMCVEDDHKIAFIYFLNKTKYARDIIFDLFYTEEF